MRRALKWFGIAGGGLGIGLIVLFVTFEWWAKIIVAQRASAAIGHQVFLEGPMDVAWSWHPRIRLADIRVANASWSPEPFMSTIRRLSFRIDLRQLMQGRVILSQIELLELVVRLESSATGVPNWRSAVDPSKTPPAQTTDEIVSPTIKGLVIKHGRLFRQDYSTDKKITLTLAELKAETTGPDEAVTVSGSGQLEAQPFQLTMHTGGLAGLRAGAPYPVQAQLQLDQWRVALNGTLIQALTLAGLDLDVSLEGAPDDVPAASPQPPYRLNGHLTRRDDSLLLESIKISVGPNRLTGRVMVERKGIRPFFRIDLSARALDVDNLMAMVAPSQSRAKQEAKTTNAASSGPAVDLQLTRAINGVLQFQSEAIKVAHQTLQNFKADVRLEDGRLTLQPDVEIAGGSIRATVEIEDRTEPLQSAVRAQIQQLNVKQILANFGPSLKAAGVLQGDVDLNLTGRTLAQLLASVDGKVSLGMTDEANDTDVTVQFATLTEQTERLVRVSGAGRIRGQALEMKGRVGSLTTFYQGKMAYPVQALIQLGETQVRLDGTVKEPRRFTGLTAKFAFSGPDPAVLSRVLPLDLPHLPAYRLEGDLRHAGRTWTVDTFKGSMGESDLEGTLVLDLRGTPMSLRGELRAQRLQIDELTAAPSSAPDNPNVPGAKKKNNQQAIPDISIDPALLRRLNADLRFSGKRIVGLGPEVRDVSAVVQIRDGELNLAPSFAMGGGRVGAKIVVVGRSDPMKSAVEATFDGVNLSEVLQEFVRTPAAFGKLKGRIALTGIGPSMTTFLNSSNGDVSLSMAGGRLDNLIIELVGLDVGEAIVAAFTDRGDTVHIRCFIADFIVTEGRMQTQTLVLDTSDSKIDGEGFIDLGQQTLHLKLVPRAKDFSLFSAESPLYIKGTFSEMSATPKLGEVLLSLATPIKPGKKDEADCQNLLESVRQ